MIFTKYDKTTGEVLGGGFSPDPEYYASETVGIYYGEMLDETKFWIDLETLRPYERQEVGLDYEKSRALEIIDNMAGEIRSKYITTAPGQELVYQQKETEANLISTNPSVSPYEIPHIMAEANLLGVTPMEVAITIQMMAAAWRDLSSVIEGKRLAAKAAVAAATNMDELRSATEVDWNG